jgi:hypothetical protein
LKKSKSIDVLLEMTLIKLISWVREKSKGIKAAIENNSRIEEMNNRKIKKKYFFLYERSSRDKF